MINNHIKQWKNKDEKGGKCFAVIHAMIEQIIWMEFSGVDLSCQIES